MGTSIRFKKQGQNISHNLFDCGFYSVFDQTVKNLIEGGMSMLYIETVNFNGEGTIIFIIGTLMLIYLLWRK